MTGNSAEPAKLVLTRVNVVRGGRDVIADCSHAFVAGTVHGILGHNGAGKTTLFDAMFGFLEMASGSISLGARLLTQLDVAYLPTDLHFYEGVTGEEVLLLFARSRTISERTRACAEALDVPLGALVDTYSVGTRRKLALVAVASLDRPVLLLDEPFEAVDVVSRRVVRHILRTEAARGRIVIYSAHELESLPSFSDRISLLHGGRFVAEYPAQGMQELEALLTADVNARLAGIST
jgi:ABC-2 type transport system ATP-binding protein